ncbi:branched-chain amino acid ABC transporter permease [Salinibacterium sp. M195]|uniref:branched-chain amino acid ABC transporter permease n=1 Tax=Salinibacterium sp. M195 TaxID=2583374 RepID=UPI001C62C790|nr:branched-chain amino acid ABC transporter permease [Salinibacterium sp. M195]QYH35097.1 branched-chain amino acid ABC transporter permease [Salinibacterium sp. M195]
MILQIIVDMVGLGATYALLTIGIALLFGILGLMNFAYGEIIMIGAFAMYLFKDYPWFVGALAAVVFAVVVSVLTERLAFRPLRNADPVTLMIASFAVSLALQSVMRMTVLPRTQGVPPQPFLTESITVFGIRVTVLQIVTLVLCGVLLGGLALLMKKTPLGVQLRASAENFQVAKSLGVKGSFVIMSAFAIAGVMAAASGIILVARQGAVSAEMGLTPLLIGIVGAVVGGMSNLKGAALGGLLLGMGTGLLEATLPTDLIAFRDAFLYSAVMVVLVIRPQGLLSGTKVRTS